jgi:hypothetical protein
VIQSKVRVYALVTYNNDIRGKGAQATTTATTSTSHITTTTTAAASVTVNTSDGKMHLSLSHITSAATTVDKIIRTYMHERAQSSW